MSEKRVSEKVVSDRGESVLDLIRKLHKQFELPGIIGQWCAVVVGAIGIGALLLTGAELGYILIAAGAILFGIFTKQRQMCAEAERDALFRWLEQAEADRRALLSRLQEMETKETERMFKETERMFKETAIKFKEVK